MHVSTKDVVTTKEQVEELGVPQGTHILSNTIEADGPFAIASKDAKLHAEVIAVRLTDSGGVFVQTALFVEEPKPAQPPAPAPVEVALTPEQEAAAYLKEKGMSDNEAASAIERFGASAILIKRLKERDAELSALLAK